MNYYTNRNLPRNEEKLGEQDQYIVVALVLSIADALVEDPDWSTDTTDKVALLLRQVELIDICPGLDSTDGCGYVKHSDNKLCPRCFQRGLEIANLIEDKDS